MIDLILFKSSGFSKIIQYDIKTPSLWLFYLVA